MSVEARGDPHSSRASCAPITTGTGFQPGVERDQIAAGSTPEQNGGSNRQQIAPTLFVGLLGQLAPSFMRRPVLHTNLDEPTQRVALDHITPPPTQVGGDQRALGLFLFICDGDDTPFRFVGADVCGPLCAQLRSWRAASVCGVCHPDDAGVCDGLGAAALLRLNPSGMGQTGQQASVVGAHTGVVL